MKKIIAIICCATVAVNSFAQIKINRSTPPKAGPAPVVTIKDPVIYQLPNGITLLVVENHKLPKVSATLSIDRGPILEGSKAGVNELMGQMLSEGTTKNNKAAFDEAIDQMGADLNLFSSGGSVSSLTRYFNKAFMMMAEAIQSPAFPSASFEKLKSLKLTGLKSNEKSASAISGRIVNALSFGKNSAMGEFETEESIKALTIEDIKKAYADNITPSRCYLTIIGDIKPEEAQKLAISAFGNWKGATLSLPVISDVSNPAKSEINFVNVPTAVQAEITVSALITNPLSNSDYHALMIANQILGGGAEGKLFMNLREKHGFTYGSYSNVGNGRFQTRFSCSAQVRSEKADSAVVEMMNEINNMRRGLITEDELNNAKAKYNGSFALGMEDPAKTASYATNILINNLPKDYYKTFLQKINSVTIDDVKRVANKYFRNDQCRIFIVGNGSKILPNLMRLGYAVNQFDKFAEPVSKDGKSSNNNITESISPKTIIDNYIAAIGGKEALSKINTIKALFTADVMGNKLSGVDMKMNPNKHYTEISMGEMKVMQSSFNGVSGYRAQMGQRKEMEEEEINEAKANQSIFPHLDYFSGGYQISSAGNGKVGDEETYNLKITKPGGKISTEFYSKKSGLLLKQETTISANGEEMNITLEFKNYQKAGNILMPYSISQTAGEREFNMEITEYKINEGVTENDFK